MTTSTPTLTPAAADLERAALWYARQGWHVFPLAPGTKDQPLVKRWESAATVDPDRIASWWSRSPFNIGIACGPSNLLVVDCDRPKPGQCVDGEPFGEPGTCDGADVFVSTAGRAKQPVPWSTFIVETGSGGLHFYFAQADGASLRNTCGRVGPLVDTRGAGGYVLAAGSVVNGRRYRTLSSASPAVVPGWLVEALRGPGAAADGSAVVGHRRLPTGGSVGRGGAFAAAAVQGEVDRVLGAVEGTRNATLNRSAFSLGTLLAGGVLDRDYVVAVLAAAAGRVGLGEGEAFRTIASGLAAGMKRPRAV